MSFENDGLNKTSSASDTKRDVHDIPLSRRLSRRLGAVRRNPMSFDLIELQDKGVVITVIDKKLLECADTTFLVNKASSYDAYCLQRIHCVSIGETFEDSGVLAKLGSVEFRVLRAAFFMTGGAEHAFKLMKVAKSIITTFPKSSGGLVMSP